jgi:hypothetical protein
LAPSIKTAIASAAIALAVAAVGAVGTAGTAYAAVPGHSAAASIAPQAPPPRVPHNKDPRQPRGALHRLPYRPPPPHRFHSRFHTLQQCQFQARHDHPGHPNLWDCRHGHDRNNSWEYWGS